MKLKNCKVGVKVFIKNSAKKIMCKHGNWANSMEESLGETGVITSNSIDCDRVYHGVWVKVGCTGYDHFYDIKCLKKASSC